MDWNEMKKEVERILKTNLINYTVPQSCDFYIVDSQKKIYIESDFNKSYCWINNTKISVFSEQALLNLIELEETEEIEEI